MGLMTLLNTYATSVNDSSNVLSPLLWKIEKEGRFAYLFGTFHAGFSLSDLPQELLRIINESTDFFIEADPTAMSSKDIMKRAMFVDGQSFDQYLSIESWNKLVSIAAKVGVEEGELKRFKPWYIEFIVGMAMFNQLNLKGALDKELWDYAIEKGIKLGYLEDTSVHLSVMEVLRPAYVLDAQLRSSNDFLGDKKKSFLSLHHCYKLSDISYLVEKTSTLKYWEEDILLRQRNKNWIPIIKNAVAYGQPFFAVGVGHILAGEDNLISLLAKEGFSLQRVQFNFSR